jgi:hypothetical protein
MQSVSLFIKGDYWDSQIYSGDLMLFGADGSLSRVDWNSAIEELAASHESIRTALRVAFTDSDLFYNSRIRIVLADPDIDIIIRGKLEELAAVTVEMREMFWTKYSRTSDTPFRFLSTDTEVYYNQIIAAGDEGLFSLPRSAAGTKDMLARMHKYHDGRVLQVKASNQNTAVAVAAGTDGLFEFIAKSRSEELLDDKRILAAVPCSGCDWAFKSIFGWNSESAFLASFNEEKDPRSQKKIRCFDKLLHQDQMFEGQDFDLEDEVRIWGSHEKVFRISGRELQVLTYQPPSFDGRVKKDVNTQIHTFSRLGFQSIDFDVDEVISVGTAPFGTVIELENRLVVLRSDGKVDEFPGEAVHWRVFPRSENYNNQLHIIYDDFIRIVSFVHDYFVDQSQKLVGFSRGVGISRGKSYKNADGVLFK